MTDFRGLLSALGAAGVEFILVGGVAAAAHGAVRTTLDLDIVCGRSAEADLCRACARRVLRAGDGRTR